MFPHCSRFPPPCAFAAAKTARGSKRTAALTVIADLKGLGLRQFYMPAVWMFRSLVEVAEQNYPYAPALNAMKVLS